ncbi:MAG: dicarboxylate transporter, DctP subunit [Rhodocyclales bacterium]|nr:dicarboxylate transporter, DctP subunit [Rhodocyclales bacterium]
MLLRIVFSALTLLSMSVQAVEYKAWTLVGADHPVSIGVQHFIDEVRTKTNGKFDGKLYADASLGDQNKAVTLLDKGEIGIAEFGVSTLVKSLPELDVLYLPFLFRDTRHLFAVMDGDIGTGIVARLAEKNAYVIGWYDGGARSFYTRNKPIRNLSDFKGLRLRVSNSKLYMGLVSALDGVPVPMPFKDVPAALESGSIDGAENNLISFATEDHYRNARYFTFTNHVMVPEALVVAPKLWATLSPEEKEIFKEAGQNSAIFMRQSWEKRQSEVRAKMEKNKVKFFNILDSGIYISRMRPVYQPYMDNPRQADLIMQIMTTSSR